MKNKKILFLTILLLVGSVMVFYACKPGSPPQNEESGEQEISHYTCPMHPQIHEDHPGECPICHMRLVPVYKEPAGETQFQAPQGSAPSIAISSERQQLIGVKTASVSRKNVAQIIRTSGRVIPLGNRRLVDVLLTPDEISRVKPAMPALISAASGAEFRGAVKEVSGIIDPVTHFGRARIEILGGEGRFQPENYVNVSITVNLGHELSMPKSAMIDTGVRRMAFVVTEENRFEAREIRTGEETDDDVVVYGGLKEGEKVVTQAAFLIDSESQLKAAITGLTHEH